jgi:hypothetical protein
MKEKQTLTQDLKSIKEAFEPTWYLNRFQSFENARSFAIDHGWRATPQKVQIRYENGWYLIEPYEKDCSCRNIIKPF